MKVVAGLLLAAALSAALLWITPPENAYNAPFLLAQQLLEGRTYLPSFLPWLEMFRHDGRDYICYPPMVSFVLVPFVWATQGGLTQPYINTALILGSAFLLYLLVRRLPGVEKLAWVAALAYAIGTPMLYSAASGDVWLLMHSEGNFFLLLALLLAIRHPVVAGFCFMVAAQSRYAISIASIAFGLAFLDAAPRGARLRGAIRTGLWFTLGALPPLLAVLWFQWATLGDPFFPPYEAAWREYGLRVPRFGTQYFWGNLPVYTYQMPRLLPEFPWLRFYGGGQSIFAMSPFFLGIFLADVRRTWVLAFLAGSLPMVGFYLLYFWSGSAQYGARYMQDLYPLLIPVALSAFARPGRGWRVALWLLLGLSIAINVYGLFVTRFL
ncbi:MAG: hypothetical protein FJ144_15775 [Deltaproteobacteria bacterium]|nr:hypothetical protein [Deltaproteobacteria bacterium]